MERKKMKTQKADVASEGAIDNSRPAIPPSNAKPRLALLIATACGLGYLPKAPGTWGSLGGILVTVCPVWMYQAMAKAAGTSSTETNHSILFLQIALFFAIAAIGVWAADRAAKYWDLKDPQKVVIDEVSGQHLTLLVGCMLPIIFGASGRAPSSAFENLPFAASLLNW